MTSADPLLIFDIGNVLVHLDNAVLARTISDGCSDKAGAHEMLEALLNTTAVSSGKMSVAELHITTRERFGFSGDFEQFEKLWCCHFQRYPSMETLVQSLARRYQLVALSNSNSSHWQFLRRNFDVMRVPHSLYASHEIGFAKPNRKAYEFVLRSEGRSARDTIFVDDSETNIEAAKTLGLQAIQFSCRAALESALVEIGIVW